MSGEAPAGIVQLLAARAAARPNDVAMRFKARGLWRDVTWRALEREMAEIALGLESRALAAGEPVVVVSDLTPTWVASLLAVHAAGALPVSLYQALGTREVADVFDALDARLLLVDGLDWVGVMAERGAAIPSEIVVMDSDIRGARGQWRVVPLAEVRAGGRAILDGGESRWLELVKSTEASRPCLLLATAGTSGTPKLVAHSARSLLASASAVVAGEGRRPLDRSDSLVVELPTGHLGAVVAGILVPLLSGAVAHLPEQVVSDAIAEVRPTVSLSSGHYWEREAALVAVTARTTRGLRGRVFSLAERTMRRRAPSTRRFRFGGSVWFGVVLLPLLRKLGLDRLRSAYVLGPVALETLQAWRTWRVELTELYWSTEAGVDVARRRGGILEPAPGVDLAVDERSRLLVRSNACAVGTWVGSTVDAIADADGWLATDDLARTKDGGIALVGRQGDIVLDGEAPVSLADIESALRGSPYFRSAIVTADRGGELVALVDLDIESVARWASAEKVSYRSPSALRDSDEVRELIRAEVAATNEKLAERGLPPVTQAVPSSDRFAIGREVGPTWSPRRRPSLARSLGDAEEDLTRAS